jgi:ankyrin repeat protein
MLAKHLLALALAVASIAGARAADQPLQQKLLHAVIQNETAEVEALLKQGADPNALAAFDSADAWVLQGVISDPTPPPLVVAASFGCIDDSLAVRLLISAGAKVNVADSTGRTPLMAASQLGWDPSVQLLLEKGADVNAVDRAGRTPLMYAMGNRGAGVAAKLLTQGAKVNAQDTAGQTALMIAIRMARHDPIRLYGSPDRPLEAWDRYVGLIQLLLDQGADPTLRDKDGHMALDSLIEALRTPPPGAASTADAVRALTVARSLLRP